MSADVPKVMYRYEDKRCAAYDPWSDTLGPSHVKVYLHEYPIINYTPKGVWINDYGNRKFVLSSGRKRFAHPTKEEAKASFIARKIRQAEIYRARVQDAETAIQIIEGTKESLFV